MMTATSFPVSSFSFRLISRAERSGFLGNRATFSSPGTLDRSTPAFAQINPCLVSAIMFPFPVRTIVFDSRRTVSTRAGSLPDCWARFFAKSEGVMLLRFATFPSARDTMICAITMMSPSSMGVSCCSALLQMSFARSSPSSIIGKSFTAIISIKHRPHLSSCCSKTYNRFGWC